MSTDITSLSIIVSSQGVREASSALGGLTTSAVNAEKRINALAEALKRLNLVSTSLTTTTGSTAALTAALTALNSSLVILNQRTGQAERSQRNHNESMREAHGLVRGLSGAFGALWITYGAFTGMAIGVAIGSSLKHIITIGKEVEAQLNFVYALTERKVDLNKFLSITESSVQSVVEAANAMRALAQNGLSVADSLAVLPSVLNLATVGEMSVGAAAIAATGAVSAFGLSIGDTARVTDIFAKTAATSNTSVLAMTESMKQASTVASIFHVTIEQTAAMLGLLAKINITGGAAGTALTNMLTGMYEPTEQAKKAMQRLGVSAFDANGKMKDVVTLMEDMRRASSDMSDQMKTSLFGDIFTARGIKAFALIQENLGGFKKKIEESEKALGFMNGVVEKLEDDASHAFTRMGVIIQNEFTRAFANAAPEVQKLGQALGDLFKGDANDKRMNTMTGEMERNTTAIANLFKNLVIFANFLVEHVKAIAYMIGAYVLWRAAIGYTVVQQTVLGTSTVALSAVFGTWRTAVLASTVATATASAASLAFNTAHAAGTATTLMYKTALEAQTAATLAATTAQKAFMAFLLPALGFLAIAIAAAAAVWLIFRNNTDDVEDANTKMSNSIHVINDLLAKEEERLKSVISLWNERKQAFNDSTDVPQEKIDGARKILAKAEEALAKGGRGATQQAGLFAGFANNPNTGFATVNPNTVLEAKVAIARQNVKALEESASKSIVIKEAKEYEKAIQSVTALTAKVMAYKKEAKATGSGGDNDYLTTNLEERRLRITEGQAILDKIKGVVLTKDMGKDAIAAASLQLEKFGVDFVKLQEKVAKTKRPDIAEPDKASINDGMQARLQVYTAQITAAKKMAEAEKNVAQSLYKQGMIGELSLIEKIREAEVNRQAVIFDASAAKIGILRNQKNQEAAWAAEKGNVLAALEATEVANTVAENARLEFRIKLVQETQKAEMEGYLARGEFVEAFKADEALKHEVRGRQLVDSYNASTDAAEKLLIKQLMLANTGAAKAGLNMAENKEAVAAFNVSAEATRNAMKGIQTATEGLGLAAMFDAASEASKRYAADLPDLKNKMGAITDPAKLNEAQAELTRLAETQRKLWEGVGESISSSLSSAFGNAGKAAGDLLMIAINTGNVETKLAEDKKKALYDVSQMADGHYDLSAMAAKVNMDFAKKEASARIKSYGDMAGAAKGFFKEGTTGYKVLEGAEKAFRAFEMFNMLKSLATSLFVSTGKAAGALAGQAGETAAVGAGEAARNLLKIPGVIMSFMSNLGPYGAIAAAVAIAAVLGGGGGSSITPETSESRQKRAGAGSVFGADDAKSESIKNSIEILEKNSGLGLVHSNGMLKSLRNIEASMVGFTNLVLRSGVTGKVADNEMGSANKFGSSAFNGLIFSKAVGKIWNAVLGGNTSILDTGVTAAKTTLGGINTSGMAAQQYTESKKDGGIFHSDKYTDVRKSLSPEVNAQFTSVIQSLGAGVTAAAEMLGFGGNAFNEKLKTFVVDLGKISLKGLSGEEIEKQFAAIFSKLGDDMAKFAIVGLEQFQNIGEGYFETLARVANNLVQVKDVFAVLGKAFGLTGLAAINVSEGLIKAAGSLEALTEGTKYFVDNFLTEADRMKPITDSVKARLAELNVSELTSVELYTKKIRQLDLTNAADQALYAALIELAPAFKEAADYADDLANGTVKLTKAQQKALDAINKARDNLQNAYSKESGALQDTIDKTKSYIETLKSFQNSLKLGANSPLTNMEKYAEARRQFDEVSAAARGGDLVAQGKFTSVANELLNASKVINASGSAYTSDFNTVLAMTTSLSDAAINQVDVATASLNALNLQVAGLIDVNKSVLTVAQAITELRLALTEGKSVGLSNTQMGITDAVGSSIVVPSASSQQTSTAALEILVGKLITEVSTLRAEAKAGTGATVTAIAQSSINNANTTVEGIDDSLSRYNKKPVELV